MSAYGGKPQPPQLQSYNTTSRTYPESSFPYPAPIYASQPPAPASTTAPSYHNAPQLTPMSYPSSQVRTPYEDQAGPYLNVGGPTPVPQVTNYSPQKGTRDTKCYVSITSLYELGTSSTPSFFLMFGHQKCPASFQKAGQQATVCSYTISCDIPPFSSTNYTTSVVPISMFMESGDGELIAKVEVGDFTYLDSGIESGSSPSQENSRKRKLSTDSTDLMKSPAKRNSSHQIRPKEEYGSYGYPHSDQASSYSSYIQPNSQYTNLVPQYPRPAPSYQGQPAPRHLYGYPGSATTSPPTIKAQSPHIGTWNSSYVPVGSNMSRSPGLPSNGGMNRPSMNPLPSPGLQANPPLIRTSTITQTPSPSLAPHGGHHGQPFNAYALYPHKAKLEIQGDLEGMALSWSEEEFESRRRLVHFRRSQSGSTITTTFSPVSVDDRPPNSICISCIYWEEKQECFVTSVDTIYLLESLVAARFTVEEKNRIRRNLEGFRPLTVSKGKPDSEEFFKVIMAFPAPKPRNIEKDVKVFHWKDLAAALKKIIGKYSASPSSTLPPALLNPSNSTAYVTEGSSAVYSSIPARVVSPHDHRPMSLQGPPGGLRGAVPGGPHEPVPHWQSSQHHMQNSQPYLNNGSNRNSWDMSNYLDHSPATSTGTSGPPQTLNYPASRGGVDSAAPGGDNRIARSMPQGQQVPRS